MSGRARRLFMILGIVLIVVSLVLIFIALAPVGETGQAQATLQPTLFLPPGGAP